MRDREAPPENSGKARDCVVTRVPQRAMPPVSAESADGETRHGDEATVGVCHIVVVL